ncbi:hypothetical protein RND71_005655 [Anisodus tanguticus]|uniref:DNA-directed RNA polymerase n=1 Tax=Anisodus tanguticus TaxID=243964 RepID=A0AAE1VLP3_9SOLA|nr:hypothetical protein RND71_005655 [Anisodus tanguticus]
MARMVRSLHHPIMKGGEILSNGAAMVGGELSLGKNVLVAYMPWEGYNSEDIPVTFDTSSNAYQIVSYLLQNTEIASLTNFIQSSDGKIKDLNFALRDS